MGKGSPPRSPRPSSPPLNLNTASMSAGDKGERHGKGGGGGGGGRRRSNSRPENAETKLFVGNLNYATTQRTLNTYFEQFGDIQECVIIFDRPTSKSRGFGFVTYHDASAAQAALREPNPLIDGRRININLAILGAKSREPSHLNAGSGTGTAHAMLADPVLAHMPTMYNPYQANAYMMSPYAWQHAYGPNGGILPMHMPMMGYAPPTGGQPVSMPMMGYSAPLALDVPYSTPGMLATSAAMGYYSGPNMQLQWPAGMLAGATEADLAAGSAMAAPGLITMSSSAHTDLVSVAADMGKLSIQEVDDAHDAQATPIST